MSTILDAARALPTAVEIRLVSTAREYAACVELQRETWGAGYQGVVPATILDLANKLGGVVAGAFLDDRLLGFVFGMAGWEDGRPIHWSHMLAVRAEVRDLGAGRRLKEFQREQVAVRGAEVMYWTYDPLVARNAHLNLNRLGARVERYVVDMYPGSGSDLHDFGTDRFVVAWNVAPPAVTLPVARPNGKGAPRVEAPVVNPMEGDRPSMPRALDAPAVRVEIPSDVFAAPELASAWRASTRRAFTHALERGYRVVAFERDPRSGRCFYVLTRES